MRVLKLPSLEFRRVRGDLIEVYKILKGRYDTQTTTSLLTVNDNFTRSNTLKLVKDRVNTNKYLKFFPNRVTNIWNKLPNHIVSVDNLNIFKNKIDDFLKDFTYSTRLDLG